MRGLTPLEFETLSLATNGDCIRSKTGPRINVEVMRELIKRDLLVLKPCAFKACKATHHLYHTDLGKLALRTLSPGK
mgnify:CR=1 FL=1